MHANLKTAGALPSLDLPHHLRADEWCPYREGVTIDSQGLSSSGTTFVEAGLRIPVSVDADISPLTRVTLKFGSGAEIDSKNPKVQEIKAEAVNPVEPREDSGYYWGYNVRRADSLSAVFTECTYEGGYDVTIGTSERGVDLQSLYSSPSVISTSNNEGDEKNGAKEEVSGKFKHLLVVFGGVAGLEMAVKNDADLQKLGVKDATDVFDHWVNVCPGQGSRTIRTEEAVWIGLMGLRRLVTAQSQ